LEIILELIYPVSRLLANPRIFYAISNYLEGPDADTLKCAFYDLLEYGFPDYEDVEEIEFIAEEISFSFEPEDASVRITLDTGLSSVLKPIDGEIKAQITNDHEMAATSAIYARIVLALEEANPEFSGNIALCSPPTPGNSYLRSEDGERFEGEFHLLTDPDRQYSFNVDIIDVKENLLKATYKQIS
jgi:hypothetical protein